MKLHASILTFSAALLASTPALAAGSATADLDVSASVSESCTISASPLAFGAYDPVVANRSTDLDGTGSVTVTCTAGAPVAVRLDQGLNAGVGSSDAAPARQMAGSRGGELSYALYSDTQRTQVWGNDDENAVTSEGTGGAVELTVYGRIPGGQNVPAGDYADTVVATVTF